MIEGHGDDAYRYSGPIRLNFSSNVYAHIDLTPLWSHLATRLTDADGCRMLGTYPEPQPRSLERRLARRLGLREDEVIVTNGATEAIYLTAQTFRGASTAIMQPTFREYADACRMHDHKVRSLYQLPDAADGWRLPDKVGMLWLCNPNNPTGQTVPKESLMAIVEANPRVVFVIDQSYEDFTRQPLLEVAEAARWSNVLLLHSFTKRYALPGLRLGFATGNGALLHQLRSHRMPWSVNSMAIEAGLFLLDNPGVAHFDLDACLSQTSVLRQRLLATGVVEVWPTDTHYMLCRLKYGTAAALKDHLANAHGMLIRDASNFEGLDATCFRVASQGTEADAALVDAVNEWIML